jgi:hypothetical protein
VGLLESLMTQKIVDDLTDTTSNRNQECIGQGLANTATGFIGGMAGLRDDRPVDHQREVRRARAAVVLLCRGVSADPGGGAWAIWFDHPDAGAGGDHDHGVDRHVLLVVDREPAEHPRSSSIVMLATVATVVYTHNLAIGVLVGVLLSGIFFAGKIAQLFRVTRRASARWPRTDLPVEGQLFFASSEDFMEAFDFKEAPERVTIDVTRAHIWDISSVQALDMAVLKFRRDGAEVEVIGLNEASETLVDRLAIHDKPGAMDKLTGALRERTRCMTNKIIALVDGSALLRKRLPSRRLDRGAGAPGEAVPRDWPARRAGATTCRASIRLGARSKLLEELSELDAQRAKLAQEHGRAILDDARAIVESLGAIEVRPACARATWSRRSTEGGQRRR